MASALTHLPLLIVLAASLLLCTFQLCSASRPLTGLNEEALMKQLTSHSPSQLKPILAAPLLEDPSNLISPTFPSFQAPMPPSSPFTNFTPIFPFPSMRTIPPFPFIPTLPTIPTFPSIPSVPLPGFKDSGSLVTENGGP